MRRSVSRGAKNALGKINEVVSGVAVVAERLKNECVNTADYRPVVLKRPFSAAC